MEAAWNEGNITVAEFMSKKIADEEQRLALLQPKVREYLALKFHNIAKFILKGSKDRAPDAVVWLQRALTLMDKANDEAALDVLKEKVLILHKHPVVPPLQLTNMMKISILRTLALAYFTSGSYDRAEAVLEELMPLVDGGQSDSHEYQELRWLRLAVLKRRKARESALTEALKSIVDHMPWSESNISEVLQELGTLSQEHTLIVTIHHHCLERGMKCKNGETDFIDRFLLSIIIHCSKDDNHSRALKTLEDTCSLLSDGDVELGRVVVAACMTAWRTKVTPMYHGFIQLVTDDLLLPAIRSINEMQKAPGFDRKMLLLATQIAHRSEMRLVLLSVLNNLLKTLKFGSSGEIVVEAMALLRCMIRLILGLLVDPTANRTALIDRMVEHFRTAKVLTISASEQKAISLIMKDISWLWRSAYNSAVQGCSEWEDCPEQIAELFDIARIKPGVRLLLWI
ncbi:hypothetical protein EST38_g8741 [Candolleomyces aberdarensis]|uniref:Protein ZIP4 homolog n=1 Tax=Candolleomyces aberdarensis TaxID=2316362 RepID=A0A4Q2DBR6_9AGAR|nr:hypothetical protein EST38_g8741 [Candolleomyces aberdarensis]